MKRLVALAIATLLVIFCAVYVFTESLHAQTASKVQVKLSASGVAPREIEETTGNAIVRDYSQAWQAMAQALDQNRADVLGSSFVGIARKKLADAVEQQKKSNLRTVYVDRGHQLQAVFYSPEGSAMQLRDTAKYDLQVYDGNSLVSSEEVTQPYLVVMTPTADRWQVRVLQAVPGF